MCFSDATSSQSIRTQELAEAEAAEAAEAKERLEAEEAEAAAEAAVAAEAEAAAALRAAEERLAPAVFRDEAAAEARPPPAIAPVNPRRPSAPLPPPSISHNHLLPARAHIH